MTSAVGSFLHVLSGPRDEKSALQCLWVICLRIVRVPGLACSERDAVRVTVWFTCAFGLALFDESIPVGFADMRMRIYPAEFPAGLCCYLNPLQQVEGASHVARDSLDGQCSRVGSSALRNPEILCDKTAVFLQGGGWTGLCAPGRSG